MIKKTELRVGNWVNYVDNGRNISTYNKVYAITEDIQTQNIYPIPLTPEILEKCGFEKKGGENVIDEEYWKNSFIELWEVAGTPNQYQVKVADRFIQKIINSLHQLQNLFFALTGEELQVNIDKEITTV